MFKLAVVLVALAALASAAPQWDHHRRTTPIPILHQSQDGPNPDGSYSWSFSSGNGIKADEQGELKHRGTKNEAMSAKGSFSYTAPDGTPIHVTYVADENGFQPKGDHLPTPPPIPVGILRGLEWIRTQPKWEEERRDH